MRNIAIVPCFLPREPIQGLFVYPDEDLATVVHALVTGPFDTPYEGGKSLEDRRIEAIALRG